MIITTSFDKKVWIFEANSGEFLETIWKGNNKPPVPIDVKPNTKKVGKITFKNQ